MRGGFSSLTIRILAILISFVSSVVVVRLLGAEEYGRYTFAFTVASMLAIPSMFGLPTLIVREIAGSEATGDWGRLRGIRNWSRNVVTLSSFAVFFGAALLILTDATPVNAELKPTLLFALLLMPLLAFVETTAATLRGLHKVFWGQFPNAVLRPTLILAGVTVAYLVVQRPIVASEAMVVTLMAMLVVVILGLYLIRKHLPKSVATAEPSYARSEWGRALIPLSIITGLQTIYTSFDLLLIGVLIGTTDAGIYRIALSIANIAGFGALAINLVVMPHYARLYKQGDWDTIWKISRYAGMTTFTLTATLTGVLYYMGQPLISFIYGDGFANAFWPTVYLSMGLAVYGIWASLGGVAMMTGKESQFLKILIASVIMNVALNLILIPLYQINGAAIATASSYLLNGILLWSFTNNIAKT